MSVFRCPLCHQLLMHNSQGLCCEHRHQFDRAKEGYFNLLPVQFKHSREPGDAKTQLQARRCFLRAGYFFPLVDALSNLIPSATRSLLDIGCGEGYFTSALCNNFPSAALYGLDISKAGIKLAAKSAPESLLYTVASSAELPFVDASMDVIMRIYAPSRDAELQRVLKSTGGLIIVTPGEDHLIGLRRKIYAHIRPHPLPAAPEGFSVVAVHEVKQRLCVAAGDHTSALLAMTPFAWRISRALRDSLIAEGINDTMHFTLAIYQHSSCA